MPTKKWSDKEIERRIDDGRLDVFAWHLRKTNDGYLLNLPKRYNRKEVLDYLEKHWDEFDVAIKQRTIENKILSKPIRQLMPKKRSTDKRKQKH